MDAAASTSVVGMSPPKKRARKFGHLSLPEKHSIIHVQKKIKMDHPHLKTAAIVDQTATTLGIATSTVYRVTKEYRQEGVVNVPKKGAGRHSLIETFCETDKHSVRRIVHNFFYKNELPTLNKIFNEIKTRSDIPQMSRSTLYKLMKQINFRYLKRNRKSLLIERDEIIKWRRKYLTTIKAYRSEGRPIYYLDETWLNEGHTKGKVWQDTTVRSKRQAFIEGLSMGLKNPSGKGRRLIILHVGSEDGFVEDSLLLFEGKKTTDYHEEMNSTVFEEWFKNLLEKLPQQAVIVMDNASYHSRRAEKIPSTSTKKKDIQNWLQSKSIQFSDEMVRVELLELVGLHREKFNRYVTDEMAESYNKTVLRLPPYHCELNPIELIWAQIKNEVASKNKTFKLAEAKDLLSVAIKNVTSTNWKKCIHHVIEEENKMWKLDGIMDDLQEPFIISIGNDSDTSLSDSDPNDDDD